MLICIIQRFNAAAERVKLLTKRPTDQELLELYALFKQASFGDNNTSKSKTIINFTIKLEHKIIKQTIARRKL